MLAPLVSMHRLFPFQLNKTPQVLFYTTTRKDRKRLAHNDFHHFYRREFKILRNLKVNGFSIGLFTQYHLPTQI